MGLDGCVCIWLFSLVCLVSGSESWRGEYTPICFSLGAFRLLEHCDEFYEESELPSDTVRRSILIR